MEARGLYDPQLEHDACGVGFVVDIAGRKSHAIVQQALQVLINLAHRGACGCEANTGDGAGILIQIPDKFLRKVLPVALPPAGAYGVGLVFLPRDQQHQTQIVRVVERIVAEEEQTLIGWRDVPTDDSLVGPSAVAMEPVFRQIFIGNPQVRLKPDTTENAAARAAFERKLYIIRKRIEQAVDVLAIPDEAKRAFYIVSLSCNTLVYKGMLTASQMAPMFPDLSDPDLESALALVHQRFSTNTFPAWPLAHPYRLIAHNGEINTLTGNINWMRAREGMLQSPLFGDDLGKLLPVIRPGGSDTASFDNVLEFLVRSGRSLPHAILMMIPEPWQNHPTMPEDVRAFYQYHASLMEPWDGPASIAFSDGTVIGAILDRNGLRPSRYYVTKDGLVILASEVGVLDIPDEDIVLKERLRPGRIFLVDTARGRIVSDEEIKRELAAAPPYRQWVAQLRDVDDLPQVRLKPDTTEDAIPVHAIPVVSGFSRTVEPILTRQQLFGYTHEDLRLLLEPMATTGDEPIGSMGTDTALAALSDRPRLLYDYFKQMFAQVTNPPLDAIREELVTSMEQTIGPASNLLAPGPTSGRLIRLRYPVLDDDQLARLAHLDEDGFHAIRLPMLFDSTAPHALEAAIEQLKTRASEAVEDGSTILILTDRAADRHVAPIPSLLAVAGVHHHLVRLGTRSRCAILVESGDAREVHHCALLLGYGASGVNPYLAFETLQEMIWEHTLVGVDHRRAVANYIHALNKGILKVMSKMGISTLQGYCGAQVFEAVGLDKAFVDEYFSRTISRIGGVGVEVIAEEVRRRHLKAFPGRRIADDDLEWGGEYQWRRDGEHHLFNPETVQKLQHATRDGQYQVFKEYTQLVDDQNKRMATLRGLLEFGSGAAPVPIEEVESIESIVKRFATGAMSYGSISQEAHETLAIAMNRLGGKSNTGEGGEDPERYKKDDNGDWRRSAVKQVASARFGVTSEYLVNADDLQIKMAQGAKPGEGGQLPGYKVYPWIAKVRHATPGVPLISPPPHHDIYSIEDLAQLIYDLKNANPEARVHVKLVALAGVGTVAAGVAKAHADVVLISGHDGGTGASPLTSIKHGGVPWELGLAETQQVLMMNRLRDRIVVQVDGQLKTGRDVVIATLLGAEEFGFATAPLVVSGCIMMRVCHLNTCPVGIATQDPELRRNFAGKAEHIVNFFRFVAEEVREYMAALGFRSMAEMIGRVDRLNVRPAVEHWKARGLNFTQLLMNPEAMGAAADAPRRSTTAQDHGLAAALDNELIARAAIALDQQKPVTIQLPIRNANRTVGTMLGYHVTRRYGSNGLPDNTILVRFKGSAGQSFGAFIPRGITLTLEGDSNDYIGKGLSGGRVAVFPPAASPLVAEENIIVGNVALYGATSGEAYIRGMAGERFAVRNSGALAVVEGVGDHGCEYMTGGRVVVLGPTGRNFAAGMSGGIAYVLDPSGMFERSCNTEMVDLEPLEAEDDVALVRDLIERHCTWTGSRLGARVLEQFDVNQRRFVKIMPRDYKRVLQVEAMAASAGRQATFIELAGLAVNG